jgi:integrase
MPKVAKALSALEVKRINSIGFTAVGTVAGLGILVSSNNSKSWVLRVTVGGKRKSMGLGSFNSVSYKDAIDKARSIKLEIESGIDPIAQKKSRKSALASQAAKNKTFKWCAEEFMKKQVFGNEKHKKQWPSTLITYAYPVIENINVADIELSHIKEILDPIWYKKNATADRVLGRIRSIIDYATVCGYRDKINPANWNGYLEHIYPKSNKVHQVTNMPSIPYADIYKFMEALSKRNCTGARCLEFLIHTAVRSINARSIRWSDVNLDEKVWVIPKELTKTKKSSHRVPLSKQALALLKAQPKYDKVDLVFPSHRQKTLSDSTLSKLMREILEDHPEIPHGVPHGFRATFKTWSLEKTKHPIHLAELSMMHTIGNAVAQAYTRGDGLENRKQIMQDWSNFICSPYSTEKINGKVIPIRKTK